MARLVSLGAIAALLCTPAQGQDKAADIDKIFDWATPAKPGCSVAVSKNGRTIMDRAYGLADLERDVPIRPTTIFDAGSLAKQFVAATVILLAEDHRLSLGDDVRQYIPELPDYGHKITIDHLLTHTSGVRDWTGITPVTSGDPDALTIVLRQRGLNFTPGEEWSYSNSGYVLLKEIVARRSGMSFADFARKRLFEPLGMSRTTYLYDFRDVVKNRALAYRQDGDRWKAAVLLDNDRGGGGGLLSTSSDLLAWNNALTHSGLGASLSRKIQEPARLNNGRTLGYARGLFLDEYRGVKEVWHSGSSSGYKSWLGRYPEHDLSIAMLCNSGDGTDRTMFAHRIFDLLVPKTEETKGADATIGTGAPVDLSGKAGLFVEESTGDLLRVAVADGKLRIAGAPPTIIPAGPNRFRVPRGSLMFMSQDEFEMRFLSPDRIAITSMEGQTRHYRRAQSYVPTAADLQSFSGRYASEEMGAAYNVSAERGMLTIRLDRPSARMAAAQPVDRDTFQIGMTTVRFRRDKSRKVVALDYSNPLIRKVEFRRLADDCGCR